MLTNFLPKRAVKVNLSSTDKSSVIEELVELLCDVHGLHNCSEVLDVILEREKVMSTGIGHGIAIPHAKLDSVSSPKMVAGLAKDGIEFDSVDGKPASIFFLLLSPKNGSGDHIKILSELSRILNGPKVREELLLSETASDFLQVLKKHAN